MTDDDARCRWWEGSPAVRCPEETDECGWFCPPHAERFASVQYFAEVIIPVGGGG